MKDLIATLRTCQACMSCKGIAHVCHPCPSRSRQISKTNHCECLQPMPVVSSQGQLTLALTVEKQELIPSDNNVRSPSGASLLCKAYLLLAPLLRPMLNAPWRRHRKHDSLNQQSAAARPWALLHLRIHGKEMEGNASPEGNPFQLPCLQDIL